MQGILKREARESEQLVASSKKLRAALDAELEAASLLADSWEVEVNATRRAQEQLSDDVLTSVAAFGLLGSAVLDATGSLLFPQRPPGDAELNGEAKVQDAEVQDTDEQ